MPRHSSNVVAVVGVLACLLLASSASAQASLLGTSAASAQPVPATPEEATTTAPPAEPHTALLVGPRFGGQLLMGQGVASAFTGAYSFGGEVNLRFADAFVVGAFVDHALGPASVAGGEGPQPSASATMTNVDAVFGYLVGQHRVRALFELGGGYRWATVAESTSTQSYSFPYEAGEGLLRASLWISAGPYVRLMPGVTFAVGLMTDDQGRTNTYSLASAGLSGDFNVGL